VPSSVNGVEVMSSKATPYVAVGGLFPSVTVSALTNCDEMFADTLNVMKKNGTAPVIAACGERLEAVVERTNDEIAGAPDGIVVDDVAVSETPAGAPGAMPIVATEELDEATVSAPPPVGTDCVTGADVGPGPATGVVLTLPPPQLATIKPPETTRAAAAIRNARNGVGIKFPLLGQVRG
jgi:hypothetical protein